MPVEDGLAGDEAPIFEGGMGMLAGRERGLPRLGLEGQLVRLPGDIGGAGGLLMTAPDGGQEVHARVIFLRGRRWMQAATWRCLRSFGNHAARLCAMPYDDFSSYDSFIGRP